MIYVTRISPPEILEKKANIWLLKLKEIAEDPSSNKKQIRKAQSKYHNSKIKERLVEMFHDKCAYCESKIRKVTYGAIEHFRPKSQYIDLTFEWSNLLFSCDICNNAKHKGDKFLLDAKGNPLLIDPTDEKTNPNKHLKFDWNPTTGLASVYGLDERGETVETIFDLNGSNGRKELIEHRSKYIKTLFALLRLAQLGDEEAIKLLEESCDPSAEYSAFAIAHFRPYLAKKVKYGGF